MRGDLLLHGDDRALVFRGDETGMKSSIWRVYEIKVDETRQ